MDLKIMRFGSVCSGIEAASVAWHSLGWKAAWFSEIEPFPSAVLAHHYPSVPNLGDMTRLPDLIRSGAVEVPDILCGGTPCQAFSVAGLRRSLGDDRGNLSLTFCEIADAIDEHRPAIIFWENVLGVLNTKDNAFGCFLAGLAGEDEALVPPGGRWTNAGFIDGPARAVAWRVLDAQHFGVAQRRRRVFVVASARADFDPAAVLFELEGVRRDTAPSRESREEVTGTLEASLGRSRRAGTPPAAIQPYTVANCLTQRMHKGINSTLDEGQTPVISIQDVTTREKAHKGGSTVAVALAPTLTATNDPSRSPQSSEVTQQVWAAMQVRRLTPVECERLQGFPDGYTNIPWRGKPESPDGSRYKALGNSWAVPVVRWIGERISRRAQEPTLGQAM